MAVRGGFRWVENSLSPRAAVFTITANKAIGATVDKIAEEMQEWAQENAPWEDRTGDARAELEATTTHRGFHHEIDLHHGVDYGIWLELIQSGTFAIILPTIEHFGFVLMDELSFAVGGED